MRALISLVRSWLVGIGVFAAMTLSLCVALTIAIAGPPSKSEIADLRALIAEAINGRGGGAPQDVQQASAERAETEPAAVPPPSPRDRSARQDRSRLLGGLQGGSPTPEPRHAEQRPAARLIEPRPLRAPAQQVERRAAPARVRDEPPAARPPPAIDSRAAQIARDADELLATLPSPPGKDEASETEASDPRDETREEETEAPQSYEAWAETWTPFGHEAAVDEPTPDKLSDEAP
jgi:hypothetical protein